MNPNDYFCPFLNYCLNRDGNTECFDGSYFNCDSYERQVEQQAILDGQSLLELKTEEE